MKALAFLICLFVVAVAADEEIKKTLYFTEIESESDAGKINFPNLKKLVLIKPKVKNLTAAMLNQLKNADQFDFIWGFCKVAYMTPQFKHFRLTESNLTSLTIDPSLDYRTDTLILGTNNLTALPAHLNVLKNLEYFSIEHNQVESVNAEDFNGLTKLWKVSLAFNKIVQLSSSPTHPTVLPELYHLYLNDNLLRNVSFADWSAPKLKQLHLNGNQLENAQSVFEPFPQLQALSVVKNPLNCGWLEFLKKEARAKKVYLVEYASCTETGETMEELIERIKLE